MRTVEHTRQGDAAQGQRRDRSPDAGQPADGAHAVPRGGEGWTSHTPRERAEDVAFAQDLAQRRPDLLEVAASYDLADFNAAVEHARRPAKSGTVLLTTLRAAGSGQGAGR
ncbi:hypothetical protein [Nocardia sp. NPDC023988]|uniref:hypothetical protein n=1 Tax=unclassified Nocardia TaxID=2637762 RepID=UPI00340C200E